MTRTLLLALLIWPLAAGAQGNPAPAGAAADSVALGSVTRAVKERPWGGIPPRDESNTTRLRPVERSALEKTALVPYHLAGLPFRLVNFLGDQSLKGAAGLGFFGLPPAEHLGLKLPLDFYLMPEFGISGLEGTTYGVNLSRYDFAGPGSRFFLTATNSSRKARNVAGGAFFWAGSRTAVQLGAGRDEIPLTRFFGLGPTSRQDQLSYYNRLSRWAGLEADHDLGRNIGLEFRAFYSSVEARDSRYEVERALSLIHQGDLPAGYPGRSRGMTWRMGLVRNNADQTGRPQSGGLQKASVSFFHDADGTDQEYLTYTLDVQHFIPLWHTRRTLGLRGFFNRIENRGRSAVPFTRLITFTRPDELRGFRSLRFYGMGSLGFSAEYRWPVWVSTGRDGPGLDAYLFSDMGQVFMQRRDINAENFEYTGGFGFRFIDGSKNFLGRFELGFSREETVVTLKFSQNFQYDVKGMLGGKDPTRRR